MSAPGIQPEDEARLRAAAKRCQGTGAVIPEDAREAAVAVLLTGASLAQCSVLLMRRAYRETDRWSGQIGLPGGHAEEEDEDLIATARRESREEVGIDPLHGDGALHIGPLPPVQATSRAQRLPLYITPIVFYRPEVEEPTCGPEADEAFWLPITPASDGSLHEDYRYDHEGLVHKLPSWNFEGRTIWGMTYGILNRYFEALFDR